MEINIETGLKYCPRCEEEKEGDNSGSDTNRKDGLQCWCKTCRSDANKVYYVYKGEQHRAYNRARTRELRELVIEGYGGACFCCGETSYEFLALDHVDGDGKEDRSKRGGYGPYRMAVEENFPDRYRLLCHNCNLAIGFYGYCPHEVD